MENVEENKNESVEHQCQQSEDHQNDDKYFIENIEEAKVDQDKAVDLYKSYVGNAETFEERKRRINNFRSGGFLL